MIDHQWSRDQSLVSVVCELVLLAAVYVQSQMRLDDLSVR